MSWIFLDNVGCCAVSWSILVTFSCVSSHTVHLYIILSGVRVRTYPKPGLGEPEPESADPHVFLTKRARAGSRTNFAALRLLKMVFFKRNYMNDFL